VRTTGFAHKSVFRTSVARWLLVLATGSAVTACSISNPLSGVSDTLGHIGGKVATVLPGQISAADKQKSLDLLRTGDAAREKGDLEAAAIGYAKAADADPSSVEAQLRLGSVSLVRQDEKGAMSAFEAAQNLAPKNAEPPFRLGEIDLTHGQAKAAADQFATALEGRQDDPKLYNAMGVALAMQGKYELAKQNYDKGLTIQPDYPALRNNYGLMQLATGDFPAALDTFSALVATSQTSARYRLNRALVEIAMGQTDAALADAPGIDEAGLRQTLAIYVAPSQEEADSNTGRIGQALISGDGGKSPMPTVHLAVDTPAAPTATAETTTASIKPLAGLPPSTTP